MGAELFGPERHATADARAALRGTARVFAAALAGHPEVARVAYPGLTSHPPPASTLVRYGSPSASKRPMT
jgi:cystathionine beta-lyase/cystathionine gamma-synthase